jgi:hypothetical protein
MYQCLLPLSACLQVDYEVHPQHRKDGKETLPLAMVKAAAAAAAAA